jgi:hypothetical protein
MKAVIITLGALLAQSVQAQNSISLNKPKGVATPAPVFGSPKGSFEGIKVPIGISTPALEGIDDKPVKIGLDSSLPHVTPGGELGHWGVGNGGDGLRIGFARARDYAANVVLRIKPNSLPNVAEPAIRDWILRNQAFLAADILQSEHLWTLEDRPTCAWTVQAGEGVKLPVSNPIQFSYPACRENTDSFLKAAQVLIHESVHHFNGDETTADKVAIGIIDAWRAGNMDAVALGLTNAPVGTERHTSVWTGKEMIVIGGYEDATQTSLQSIRAYDPRSDSWRSLEVPQEFGARHDAAAVWTGKEVLIWGGFRKNGNSTEWAYSGILLNPETGSYRSVKTPEFWSPKASTWEWDPRQTLIWTGDKAIVWGGVDSKTNDPLGAILTISESGATWKRMNVSSEWAPQRIGAHSAIWTGEKMVIWGGYAGTSDASRSITNTGGIYSLRDDSWEPTVQTGAPSARASHQAVWTGSKMIILSGGGVSSSIDLRSTGGSYDIEKGTWVNYTNELLVERTGHKAIWNGEEILLVGGKSTRLRTYFGEVFAFNPATQRWRILGSSVTPSARSNPSIIWTGSSAIVWGGQCEDRKSERSGGIYYP